MTSLSRAARQGLSSRTIRVLVTPTPVTFFERRAVLQVLEKHGAVQVFRMTPDYYANFISVTRDEVTAERLVTNSPITYRLRQHDRSQDKAEGARVVIKKGSNDDDDNNNNNNNKDERTKANKESSSVADFALEIFPEPDYRHDFSTAADPARQPWPPIWQNDGSIMATTLQQSLPKTLAATGLAHWFLPFQKAPTQYMAWRLALKSWLPSKMRKGKEGDGGEETTTTESSTG
ncbi:hypothetical protein XA68_13214 [Ophiocordyceps unilateralis]|uniref:Uncharacterized protein n=1 Tax=Ophiocordyceps unilateralis TaxID=268505 RepID=A0A2A9PD07_OPHUN|nr:hypothetical protein XA68_13214 [Ophiocordyceps unilateralis]